MSWDCPRAMPNPTGAGSTVSRCLCCWRDVYVEGECFGIRVELAGIALEREGVASRQARSAAARDCDPPPLMCRAGFGLSPILDTRR
jgi:hypothetical protein